MNFIDQLRTRRSIYHLGRQLPIEESAVQSLVKEAVKAAPSAFNSQSSRVVTLFGEAHEALWEITEDALKPLVAEDQLAATVEKIASFRAAYGTILFFEDNEVIEGLQKNFPLYAENFPKWSEQSTGMAQLAVWTALANESIGASLQHYNPLIDEAVAERWSIPQHWRLMAQMPFGSIETPADEKSFMEDEARFKVFHA